MSGAFVRDDEERTARLEDMILTEKRTAMLDMLMKKRERLESDPKLSALPVHKKQEILARIEKEMTDIKTLLAAQGEI